MTAANNHLLQKVTFEIGLGKQEGAFEIQNRISNAFQSLILRELEQLFDEKVRPDQVITIQKLEINLGNISSADLERDMEKAFRREFETFMAELSMEIARAISAPDNKPGRVQVRWNNGANAHAEVSVSLSDSSASYFEKVTQLLLTGVAGVSAQSASAGTIADMIHKVLELHAGAFVTFLRRNNHKPRLLHRLALNLTVPQLTYLLSLLGASETPVLGEKIKETASLLKKLHVQLSTLDLPSGIRFPEPEQLLWWLLLIRFTNSGIIPETGRSITPRKQSAVQDATLHAEILTELLFVAERLSQRSLFESSDMKALVSRLSNPQNAKASSQRSLLESNGTKKHRSTSNRQKDIANTIRDYHLSPDLQYALEAVITASVVTGENSNEGTDRIVDPVLKSQQPIMGDNSGLLKNSLFTLPDKSIVSAGQSGAEDAIPQADTGIYINNAGLVLLAPFLKPFFTQLGLIEGKSFTSTEAKWRAAHILQKACGFQVTDENPTAGEADMIFNKLLCGIEIHEAIPENLELTERELEEIDALLKSILHHWTIMSRSSVQTLQATFLQKQGRLSITGKDWDLLIERDSAVEILIDRLPWSIGFIKLPWTDYAITTTW